MNQRVGKLIREAMHAGSWYTSNAEQLNYELSNNLVNAHDSLDENTFVLKALIGPHAGLRFCGANAAYAYASIKDANQFDRVFILGPSHKIPLDFIVTTECDEWETPLGNLIVDKQTIAQLMEFPKNNPLHYPDAVFQQIDKKHEENEHSLEMHLPYIRKVFESRKDNAETDIKIVPLMVG